MYSQNTYPSIGLHGPVNVRFFSVLLGVLVMYALLRRFLCKIQDLLILLLVDNQCVKFLEINNGSANRGNKECPTELWGVLSVKQKLGVSILLMTYGRIKSVNAALFIISVWSLSIFGF